MTSTPAQKITRLSSTLICVLALFSCRDVENDVTKKENAPSRTTKEYALSGDPISVCKGQLVYIPLYAMLDSNSNMSNLLSLRNTSTKHSITITDIDIYDSDGKLIEEFVNENNNILLDKLASKEIEIKRDDTRAGRGGNFLIRWQSEERVNPPLLEMLNYGSKGTQGFSFSHDGVVIDQW